MFSAKVEASPTFGESVLKFDHGNMVTNCTHCTECVGGSETLLQYD